VINTKSSIQIGMDGGTDCWRWAGLWNEGVKCWNFAAC
jgi:hypothetical protein